jgi:hypothetical protein
MMGRRGRTTALLADPYLADPLCTMTPFERYGKGFRGNAR